MKRVVTGEVDGKSVFLDTTEMDALDPVVVQNMTIYSLWGYDDLPGLPFAGPGNDHSGGFYGQPGQLRCVMIKYGPEGEKEVVGGDDQLSGLIEDDGRHATDTLDIDFIISGELGIEVDDKEIRWLTAGDVVVQHGSVHVWHNRSGKDALLGAITVGLAREGASH